VKYLLRLTLLALAGTGHLLLTSSAPTQPLDVTTLTDEDLIELQYRDDAKAELDRRIAELPYPEQEAVRALQRDYVPERNFPDDFSVTDLMTIYLSQPGLKASEVTIRTLIERTGQYSDADALRHRKALESQARALNYPETGDNSATAEYQRTEYLLVARLIVCTTPEDFAIPLVRELTLGKNIDGGASHLVGLLPGVQHPGPATIALVEELYADLPTYVRPLLYDHPGELQDRLYGILSRCGAEGIAAMQRLGGWDTSALGLDAMASIQLDSARDLLLELYHRRKTEENYAYPAALEALASRLYYGPDPIISDLLREELPALLKIPRDKDYRVRDFGIAVSIAGKSRDTFFIALLEEFRALLSDGTSLRSAKEYNTDRTSWEQLRNQLLYETDRAIRSLQRASTSEATNQ